MGERRDEQTRKDKKKRNIEKVTKESGGGYETCHSNPDEGGWTEVGVGGQQPKKYCKQNLKKVSKRRKNRVSG